MRRREAKFWKGCTPCLDIRARIEDFRKIWKGRRPSFRYAKRVSSALDMENLPERYNVLLHNGWSVTFGASENPIDGESSQRLMYISMQFDEPSNTYYQPWQVRLEAFDMRSGEKGYRAAKVFPIQGNWYDDRIAAPVPYCAKEIPQHIEAARLKETQALLKLGRDNQWPIKMTIVSAVSEYNVISISYDVDWAGIKWEDDEVSVQWCWSKFIAKAKAENLTAPPALLRKDVTWTPYLRKSNNSLWITLKEGQTWGPEDAGPAPMILFGPPATIKMRSTASNPVDQLMACLYTMYQGRYVIHERVATREWALVATIGDQSKVGQVPIQYRLPKPQVSPSEVRAFHQGILDSSLITQNYDRGMDKFVRKFVPEECMTATRAI
jgi:hypothetical protein